jgi:hypothetical protein
MLPTLPVHPRVSRFRFGPAFLHFLPLLLLGVVIVLSILFGVVMVRSVVCARWASTDTSTGTDGVFRITVSNLSRSWDDKLTFDFQFEIVKETYMIFSSVELVYCLFFDDTGKETSRRKEVRVGVPEAFRSRDAKSFVRSITVSVPRRSTHLMIIGPRRIVTSSLRIPGS